MTNRQLYAQRMKDAARELQELRAQAEVNPEAAFMAYSRAICLLASAAWVLECPQTFDLEKDSP